VAALVFGLPQLAVVYTVTKNFGHFGDLYWTAIFFPNKIDRYLLKILCPIPINKNKAGKTYVNRIYICRIGKAFCVILYCIAC